MTKYLKLIDEEIPINIRSYKNSKSVKIFFKGNILNITKPTRLSINDTIKIIKQNEKEIYDKYRKILSSEIQTIKQWKTGEKIYYKGKQFIIKREDIKSSRAKIQIDEEKEQIIMTLPEETLKENVDDIIKKILKKETEKIIKEKVPYWSNITGLEYNSVKVRDATSRFGSCMPSKKNLYFSSRLVMLPPNVVDAIIVHEFCHMVHKNHSKEFYNLVEKYIVNYKEIDKWLRKNGKVIMF